MVGATHENLSTRNFSTYCMEEHGRDCCVRGYHVYQEIWEAAVSEVLVCEREPRNVEDRYAVAEKKDGTVIGHLPRKISRICSRTCRFRPKQSDRTACKARVFLCPCEELLALLDLLRLLLERVVTMITNPPDQGVRFAVGAISKEPCKL